MGIFRSCQADGVIPTWISRHSATLPAARPKPINHWKHAMNKFLAAAAVLLAMPTGVAMAQTTTRQVIPAPAPTTTTTTTRTLQTTP